MELRDVDRVAPEDLKQRVENGEAFLLVDVQPEGQFLARHIVGARNIPLGIVEDGTHGLPRDSEVVLYCACPEEADAIRAAAILRSHAYDRLRVLTGGLLAWVDRGYPTAGRADAQLQALCLGPQVHRWTPEAQQWLFSNPLFEWRIAGYRDIREAAGMLGVSIERVRDWEGDRQLPTDREFSRLRRVTALADLKGRWVAWQRAKPPE